MLNRLKCKLLKSDFFLGYKFVAVKNKLLQQNKDYYLNLSEVDIDRETSDAFIARGWVEYSAVSGNNTITDRGRDFKQDNGGKFLFYVIIIGISIEITGNVLSQIIIKYLNLG